MTPYVLMCHPTYISDVSFDFILFFKKPVLWKFLFMLMI